MENILEFSIYWVFALAFVAFLAGYIDAVAGGGGMLNLPALLFAGVPPVSALAVSKMSAIAGTVLAVIKFTLSKRVHWKTVFIAAVPCLIASYLGGKAALNISGEVLASTSPQLVGVPSASPIRTARCESRVSPRCHQRGCSSQDLWHSQDRWPHPRTCPGRT